MGVGRVWPTHNAGRGSCRKGSFGVGENEQRGKGNLGRDSEGGEGRQPALQEMGLQVM